MKTSQVSQLICLLLSDTFTVQDARDHTKLDIETVRRIVKDLHKQGFIYVADWEYRNEGRIKLPIYKLGEGDDKERPKRISAVEATRRYKEKVRRGTQRTPNKPHVPDPVAFSDSGRIITHRIAQPEEKTAAVKRRTENPPPRQQSWFSSIEK